MNSYIGNSLLLKVKGRYKPNLRELVSAVSVVLIQVFGILWLGLEDSKFSLSPVGIGISLLIVVIGFGYLLKEELRTVVVDEHRVDSKGPFGVFRQIIEEDEIEEIRLGGISRGIKVDFVTKEKVVRFTTNRRFHKKIHEVLESNESA